MQLKIINFMAKHGRGLICLALSKKQIDNLKLPLMSPINRSRMQTALQSLLKRKKEYVSQHMIEQEIKTAINLKLTKGYNIARTCISFSSKTRWSLERAGHTEASVDISKLSKLNPSSVICEVMNEDGRMARLNDLFNSKT